MNPVAPFDISTLDLSREADQLRVPRREKWATLEGACAELEFRADLLDRAGLVYSTGWWLRREGRGYRLIRYTTDVSRLSRQDEHILHHFTTRGVATELAVHAAPGVVHRRLFRSTDTLAGALSGFPAGWTPYPATKVQRPVEMPPDREDAMADAWCCWCTSSGRAAL